MTSMTPIDSVIDISPENDGKLLKQVVKEGNGWESPRNGDKVMVHYIGILPDDHVFDSSRDRNEQFSFTVGAEHVIQGLDLAVKTMTRGETAKFTIDSGLAYGQTEAPPKIGLNQTLLFEIELFDWDLEDITENQDSGVVRKVKIEGEGSDSPNIGDICDIHITGKYNYKVFDEGNVSFCLGEGSEYEIIDGIEMAVKKMKRGDQWEITVKPQYAYGYKGGYYGSVVYEVTLVDFENFRPIDELDSNERIEYSAYFNSKGNQYFKEGLDKLSIKVLKRIDQYLSPSDVFAGDLKSKRDEVLLCAHLNLSVVYSKVENYLESIKSCEKALEIDPKNKEGLFRRANAYFATKEYDLAKRDLESLLIYDTNNIEAKRQLDLCEQVMENEKEWSKHITTEINGTENEINNKFDDNLNNKHSVSYENPFKRGGNSTSRLKPEIYANKSTEIIDLTDNMSSVQTAAQIYGSIGCNNKSMSAITKEILDPYSDWINFEKELSKHITTEINGTENEINHKFDDNLNNVNITSSETHK